MDRKKQGQYMTPDWLVSMALDAVGYKGAAIFRKKIMEPAFGEGAFLTEIISRIYTEGRSQGKSGGDIATILRSSVFGIEKDPELYAAGIRNVELCVRNLGLPEIDWSENLICGDTLRMYERYAGRMDFVVGNPPYVSCANMDPEDLTYVKEMFPFCTGRTDLYVAFYNLGVQMLKEQGRLAFITPNRFMHTMSQSRFRDWMVDEHCISKIYNFKTMPVFSDASTHVCICVLDMNRNRVPLAVDYREFDGEMLPDKDVTLRSKCIKLYPWVEFMQHIQDNGWILGEDVVAFFNTEEYRCPVSDLAVVQNGISTNRDKVYVHKVFMANGMPYMGKHTDYKKTVYLDAGKKAGGIPIESSILHRCVKASTFAGELDNTYIIYPYADKENRTVDMQGNLIPWQASVIPEDEMKQKYPLTYQYLLSQKEELLARDMKGTTEWYQYARSQGIVNSHMPKIVFSHIIRGDKPKIQPYVVEEDVIVYSGLYINLYPAPFVLGRRVPPDFSARIFDRARYMKTLHALKRVFRTADFRQYIKLIGKPIQNGYISFSAKQVGQYGIPWPKSNVLTEYKQKIVTAR